MLQSSKLVMATIALCAALTAGGCGMGASGSGGVAGALERLEPLAEKCEGPIVGYAGIDMSSSARGNLELQETRLGALRASVDQVAACGGSVKVVAFSASAPETFTLGEAELPTDFGTETARLIKANEEVEELLSEVEEAIPPAEKALEPNGTDVLAQLTLAKQFHELNGEGELQVLLETDGIATTKPVKMNVPEFDAEAAREAAAVVAVPDLSGARVSIVGVGKTSGDRQLSTEKATAIADFFTAACERAGAQCLVTNDYMAGG